MMKTCAKILTLYLHTFLLKANAQKLKPHNPNLNITISHTLILFSLQPSYLSTYKLNHQLRKKIVPCSWSIETPKNNLFITTHCVKLKRTLFCVLPKTEHQKHNLYQSFRILLWPHFVSFILARIEKLWRIVLQPSLSKPNK